MTYWHFAGTFKTDKPDAVKIRFYRGAHRHFPQRQYQAQLAKKRVTTLRTTAEFSSKEHQNINGYATLSFY
jgi:hypothetical protein